MMVPLRIYSLTCGLGLGLEHLVSFIITDVTANPAVCYVEREKTSFKISLETVKEHIRSRRLSGSGRQAIIPATETV